MISTRTAALAVVVLVLLTGAVLAVARGGGGDSDAPAPLSDGPIIEDGGPQHVHALAAERDGSLLLASHTGVFRVRRGEAHRIAGRFQDTMAFTPAGDGTYLASGHPDGREGLPPFLGLIVSDDAAQTWKPRSLQGKLDFHLLEVADRVVYGYGTDFASGGARFLSSGDGGRTWKPRTAPAPLISLAIDPRDRRSLLASSDSALFRSEDGGRSWRRARGTPGLLTWEGGRLYVIDGDGVVSISTSRGPGWQAVGDVGGAPAAFDPADGRLLAALHDGAIKESRNGGVTWKVLLEAPS